MAKIKAKSKLQQKPAAPSKDSGKNKKLSFHLMVPNMMTITALCFGLTAIQFSIAGRWEIAVLSIVVAAFIDGFDGAVARLLKADTQLGAELDSFSDFLCFGVAPAIMIYLWSLHEAGRWGWMVALFFCVATVLRLARFNATAKAPQAKKDVLDDYFAGIPAPMGGGLCLLPLVISFQSENLSWAWTETLQTPLFIGIWTTVVAIFMVSNIPTFSSKQIHLSQKLVVPALAIFGLMAAGLINAPWPTLLIIASVYIMLIPFGILHYYRAARLKKAK